MKLVAWMDAQLVLKLHLLLSLMYLWVMWWTKRSNDPAVEEMIWVSIVNDLTSYGFAVGSVRCSPAAILKHYEKWSLLPFLLRLLCSYAKTLYVMNNKTSQWQFLYNCRKCVDSHLISNIIYFIISNSTGWGRISEIMLEPISETIYAVDTISQLPKAC